MLREKLQLRPCNLEDVELIFQLDRLMYGDEAYPHFVLRQFYDVCGDFISVAATLEGEVVAYSIVSPKVNSQDSWILALSVNPEWQRQGIARQLTVNCINKLTALGFKNVWLTVKPDNEAAISLYNKLGFDLVIRQADYFGESADRNVMKKMLSEIEPTNF